MAQVKRFRFLWWWRYVFVILLLCMGAVTTAQELTKAAAHERKHLLVVHAGRHDLPETRGFEQGLREGLGTQVSPIDVLSEYLDSARFPADRHAEALSRYFADRYAGQRIDLVLTTSEIALDFVIRYRDRLFQGIPVIFSDVQEGWRDPQTLPQDVRGYTFSFDYLGTLKLIQALQPRVREVVVIHGAHRWDVRRGREVRAALAGLQPSVPYRILSGSSQATLQKQVSQLPADSAVFFISMMRDAEGTSYLSHEVIRRLAEASTAPVYSTAASHLEMGVLGGAMVDYSVMGRTAAAAVLKTFSGEKIPVVSAVPLPPLLVNGNALQKWGIPENGVPSGATVLFRKPSIWEEHRAFVLAASIAVVLQALLITLLMRQLMRRRKAESALGESEQRMSLAVEAVGMGIWGWDPTTGEMWLTLECRALFGWPREGAITFDTFMDRIHPQERQHVKSGLDRVLVEGGKLELETRILLPDGNVRWVVVRGMFVERPHKQRQLLGVCVDVTSRKTSELAAKQHLNAIAHMTRVSTMGELGASLSHELNQPLTAILSNAQAAQRFMATQPFNIEELREILKDIVDDDLRAGEVIRRMRSLVKKGEPEFTSVDFGEVMSDVAKLVRGDATLRNVRIALQCDPGIPRVSCDPIQIQQVTLNLLMNAFDAMGEVPISERGVVMRVDGNGADTVKVMVSDGGTGLAPDTLSQMFNPFYTTKSKGLGMGLAISRSIIEAHGGRLWAENNAERGAAFYFTLPVVRARPVARSLS